MQAHSSVHLGNAGGPEKAGRSSVVAKECPRPSRPHHLYFRYGVRLSCRLRPRFYTMGGGPSAPRPWQALRGPARTPQPLRFFVTVAAFSGQPSWWQCLGFRRVRRPSD